MYYFCTYKKTRPILYHILLYTMGKTSWTYSNTTYWCWTHLWRSFSLLIGQIHESARIHPTDWSRQMMTFVSVIDTHWFLEIFGSFRLIWSDFCCFEVSLICSYWAFELIGRFSLVILIKSICFSLVIWVILICSYWSFDLIVRYSLVILVNLICFHWSFG